MSVWAAYLTVLLVWSTTPLAISWSSESLGPMAALSLRLLVSILIASVVRILSKSPALRFRKHWKAYASGAIGLFPCMALVYWSASYLPSSLISVLFGLAPFAVVLLNIAISSSAGISFGQLLGMTLAFLGLLGVMAPSGDVGAVSVFGAVLILIAVMVYALSTLLVKRYALRIHVPNQLLGTLLFAMPFFMAAWAIEGVQLSEDIPAKAIYATLYLGAMGSVVGFLAYFYLLKRISVAAVSLITMVTPAIAVVLGVWLNAEVLSLYVYLGIACILTGLWVFRYFEANPT